MLAIWHAANVMRLLLQLQQQHSVAESKSQAQTEVTLFSVASCSLFAICHQRLGLFLTKRAAHDITGAGCGMSMRNLFIRLMGEGAHLRSAYLTPGSLPANRYAPSGSDSQS